MKERQAKSQKKNFDPKKGLNQRTHGITLIALVVTVVILIILALIGINAAFGDGGIIKKGQLSKEEAENMSLEEKEKANEFWSDKDYNDILKLSVTQTAEEKEYKKGDTIQFTVKVRNSGEIGLKDVELKDTLQKPDGGNKIPSGFKAENGIKEIENGETKVASELSTADGIIKIGELEVGDSRTFQYDHIVEEEDLGGILTNNILATGVSKENPEDKTNTLATKRINTESLNPNLQIAKKIVSTASKQDENGNDVYMVGEEIKYQITVRNIGNAPVGNIELGDELTVYNEDETVFKKIPMELDYFYDKKENGTNIGKTLEKGQTGYSSIYSYTVQQEDLGKIIENNAWVKGKNKIPTGEKTPTDKKSGTITVTKSVNQEGMENDNFAEATKRDYTFHIYLEKNGTELSDTLYYTDVNKTRKTIRSGETFTLKHGESISITGVPDGTNYKIWEDVYQIGDSGYCIQSDQKEYVGTINLNSTDGEIATVSCINREAPSLKIEKDVLQRPKDAQGNDRPYLVGEEIQYQVRIENIGRIDVTVTGMIIEDELKRQIAGTTQKDPIKTWSFDTLYKDQECTTPIGNVLKPGETAYTPVYRYVVKKADAGATLINNAKIKNKIIPPGEKEEPIDPETGVIEIKKIVKQEEVLAEHLTEALSHSYNFHITLEKNGTKIKDAVYCQKSSSTTKTVIQNGEGTFTLKDGETIKITGVPDGIKYKIWEDKYNVANSGNYIQTEKESYEGTINLATQSSVSIECVNYEEIPLGNLEISKTLQSYNASLGPVTFIFKIEATQGGKKVYSDVVSMVFTSATTQKITIENIPVGAEITVEEVYSGASYTVVGGDSIKTCKILNAGTTATVSFTNAWDNKLNTGTSVINHVTKGKITQITPTTPDPDIPEIENVDVPL